MADRGAALVEHYHQTYELTYKFWKERNRAFLMLITTLGIAALISYDARAVSIQSWTWPGTGGVAGQSPATRNTFLLTVLCHAVKDKDCNRDSKDLKEFAEQFPHDIFDGIISVIVLYLMMNITNLTSTISRYYRYIERLEEEVREELGIGRWKDAFSREGLWYQRYRAPMQQPIRYFYVFLLAAMLGFYFLVRIGGDLQPSGNPLRCSVHAAIALLSFLALYGYASNMLGWHKPKAGDKS